MYFVPYRYKNKGNQRIWYLIINSKLLILQSGLETRFLVLGTRSSFIESQKFNNNIIIEQAQKIKNRELRTQDRVPSNQERAHSSDG